MLDPAGDAGRAESLRAARPAQLGDVRRASTQRELKKVLDRAHVIPSPSGSPNIRLRFCTACEAAPFHRLSIAPNTIDAAGALVAVDRDAADVRLADVAHAGRRRGELDERLVGVGVAVELLERRAASPA